MDGHYPKLRHWLNSVTNLEIRQDFFCSELLKGPGRFALHTSKRFRKRTLSNLELPYAAWVLRGSRTERPSVSILHAVGCTKQIAKTFNKEAKKLLSNGELKIDLRSQVECVKDRENIPEPLSIKTHRTIRCRAEMHWVDHGDQRREATQTQSTQDWLGETRKNENRPCNANCQISESAVRRSVRGPAVRGQWRRNEMRENCKQ